MYTIFIILIILDVHLYGINAECQWEDSYIRGKYYVVGLYKMFTNYDQSEYDKDAVRLHLRLRYFIEHEYYYNHKTPFGYLGFNICNEKFLVESLMNVILNPHFKPDQSAMKDTDGTCRCKTCECAKYSSNVLAIFIYLPTDLTELAINILRVENIPVFVFSNKLPFNSVSNDAFYASNMRIHSSYEIGHFPLLHDINRYDIKHVAIINIGNVATNLVLYHQARFWSNITTKRKVCIQRKFIDPSNIKDIKMYIDYIRHDESLQLIAIWSHQKNIRPFIDLTNNITNKQWIWYTNSQLLSIAPRASDFQLNKNSFASHKFFFHPVYSFPLWDTEFSFENMSFNIYTDSFRLILKDRWVSGYINQMGLNRSNSLLFKDFDNKTTLNQFYIDSLVMPLWNAGLWAQPRSKTLEELWSWIDFLATEIDGNQQYLYTNLNRRNICQIVACYPGYEPKYETYYNMKRRVEMSNWHCVKCPTNSIKLSYSSGYCRKCNPERKSNSNRTVCYDPYTEVSLQAKDPVVIAMLLLTFVGILFNIFGIVIFVIYKRTPIVRASGFDSSMLHLFSHLMLFTTVPVSALIKQTQINCIVQPVLFGTLLTIIITVTLTKTFKALHAFNTSLVLSKSAVRRTKVVEWFILIIVVAVQISIGAISLFLILPSVDAIPNKELVIRYVFCANLIHLHVQLAYVFIVSFLCLVQAFRARNLPGRFNESKKTTYSMLITILILGVTFAISQSQEQNKKHTVVIFISITIINIIQLFVMYSYKIFVVIFRAETNTKQAFQQSMMRNAEKVAARHLRLAANAMPDQCVTEL